jgi:hypothetical protein
MGMYIKRAHAPHSCHLTPAPLVGIPTSFALDPFQFSHCSRATIIFCFNISVDVLLVALQISHHEELRENLEVDEQQDR